MFSSLAGHRDPPVPAHDPPSEKSAPESSFSCKTGPEKPSDSDLFIGGPPWPFSWQISPRKTQSMPKTKTHPFLEVKSGSDMGVFSQKNLVLKTFRSGSNPGVLRGFPERESGNRSPIRACFPGADIPFRARNKAGSGDQERPQRKTRETIRVWRMSRPDRTIVQLLFVRYFLFVINAKSPGKFAKRTPSDKKIVNVRIAMIRYTGRQDLNSIR